MLERHVGGEHVNGGIYWDTRAGQLIAVPQGGGSLAGTSKELYLRVPLPLVLLLGPLMGVAFILILPFTGFLVIFSLLGRRRRVDTQPRPRSDPMSP